MADDRTIEILIQAHDAASVALKQVEGAMASLKGATQTASTGISGSMSGLNQVFQSFGQKAQSVVSAIDGITGSGRSLVSTFATVGAAIGGAAIAQSFIQINDSAERAKIMLTGMSGSTIDAAKSFAWLMEQTNTMPYSLSTLQSLFTKLVASGIDPMDGSMRALVDSVAAFGGTEQDIQLAGVAIQQMASKGVVSMEELRGQLGERIPTAIRAMAEGLGMSMQELIAKVETGTLQSDRAIKAMLDQLSKYHGGMADSMMNTWSGLIAKLRSAWDQFSLALGQAGVFTILSSGIASVIAKIEQLKASGELSAWVSRISSAFSSVFTVFSTFVSILGNVISAFGPFLPVIAGSVAILKTFEIGLSLLLSPMLLGAKTVISLTSAWSLLTGATTAAAAAQGTAAAQVATAGAASAAASTAMKVGAGAAGLAVGYLVGELIQEAIWANRVSEAKKQAAETSNLLKSRYDVLAPVISTLQTSIAGLTEKWKQSGGQDTETADRITLLSESLRILQREQKNTEAAISNYIVTLGGLDAAQAKINAAYMAGQITQKEYESALEKIRWAQTELTNAQRDAQNELKLYDDAIETVTKALRTGQIAEDEGRKLLNSLRKDKEEYITVNRNIAQGIVDVTKQHGGLQEALAKTQQTYDEYVSKLSGDALIKAQENELKLLEQTNNQKLAVLKTFFDAGAIGYQQYADKVIEVQDIQYQREINLIKEKIASAEKEGQAGYQKRLMLEQELAAKIEQQKTTHYNTLDSLMKQNISRELEQLQVKNNMADAQDQASVTRGLMTQSQYLQNRLTRLQESMNAEMTIRQNALASIEGEYGKQSEQYKAALAQMLQAQSEYQAKVIQAEAQITQAKAQEAQKQVQIVQQSKQEMASTDQWYFTQMAGMAKNASENVNRAYTAMQSMVISVTISSYSEWKTFQDKFYSGALKISQKLFDTLAAGAHQLAGAFDVAGGRLSELERLIKNAMMEGVRDVGAFIAEYKRLQQQVDDVNKSFEEATRASESFFSSVTSGSNSLSGLNSRLSELEDKIKAGILAGQDVSSLVDEYNKLKKKLEEVDDTFNDMTESQDNLNEEAGKLPGSFEEAFNNMKDTIIGWNPVPIMTGWVDGVVDAGGQSVKAFSQAVSQTTANTKAMLSSVGFGADGKAGITTSVTLDKKVDLNTQFEVKTFDEATTKRWLKDTVFPEWEGYMKAKGVTI